MKEGISQFIALLHTLSTKVLSSQRVGSEGVISRLPEPPGSFLIVLLRTVPVGIALADPVPQIFFLLRRLFCLVKGFQSILKPPLRFFRI